METFFIALIFLMAVVASGVVARSLPIAIPLPLINIMFGMLIVSIGDFGVSLDPELFFVLFLPPLLFLDGWRIPKEGLLRDRHTILQLAIGMVVFTVLGLGLFIHWMIPTMPLSVAFALAAILSPTDPVAVSSITQKVPVPKRLMHILEGESLLNDASGLVCMRFAVAATLTGVFSLGEASLTFVWLVIGGLGSGYLVTKAIMLAKGWVTRHFGQEPGSEILISLLTPFAAYFLAEHVEASGILAAVAAGMTMSFTERVSAIMATTRLQRTAVWDAVQFTLNGVMFVLLGEQLPKILKGAQQVVEGTGHVDLVWLLVYIVAINLALYLFRFLWVWLSLRFTLLVASHRGETMHKPSWRLVAATVLSGVRGAVTLAGILTLPLMLNDGTAFPSRDLAILLAAGVIIASLISASIGLPLVLDGLELPPEPSHREAEDKARLTASENAIKAVEAAVVKAHGDAVDQEMMTAAAGRVIDFYRQRIADLSVVPPDLTAEASRTQGVEKGLWAIALKAERDAIQTSQRGHRLSDEAAGKLVREVDLHEARLRFGRGTM